MYRPISIAFWPAILLTICCATTLMAAPRVELEVVFQPNVQANATAQKWTKTLGELGLRNVRFQPMQSGDSPAIKTEGAGDTAVSRVTAVMNSRGALVTPGGQFMLSDSAKLKQWLGEVQATGGKLERTVFGLLPKQFEEVKRQLAAPVGFATKGMRPEKAIEQIRAGLPLPLQIDPAIAQALAADDPVRDELEGVSLGTARQRRSPDPRELCCFPKQTAIDWNWLWSRRKVARRDGRLVGSRRWSINRKSCRNCSISRMSRSTVFRHRAQLMPLPTTRKCHSCSITTTWRSTEWI